MDANSPPGARRGELVALDGVTSAPARSALSARSSEPPSTVLQFKPPKTDAEFRTISLPPSAVSLLRDHRKQQLELRMQLGMGKLEPDALVFCKYDGTPLDADYLARR